MFAALISLFLTQTVPPASGSQMWWYNDTCTRAGGRCQYMRNGRPPNDLAFFEFAPANGAGVGTACACAPITGAKGEALTFTRTGNATCSKQGLATTGIANGDLVVCTANLPRVEPSGGVLGLRVEGARTNETLRSQEIENAVWAISVNGVSAPTITANFATAPDGTLTADRMQIPACPVVGDVSGINQTSVTIASPSTSSVYMKANAGNPSVSVCMYGITTGTRACTQFALNTSTWTRAVVPNVTNTGGMNMEIACENRTASYTGATDTGAADILVWGAQSEAGADATGYIPTVATAMTRNAETPNFAGVSLAGLASTGCARAYVTRPSGATGGTAVYFESNGRPLYFTAASQTAFDGTNNPNLATTFNGSAKWYITRWTGSSLTLHNQDTSAATTAFDGTMGVTGPLQIGFSALNLHADGIISRVQLDPDPTRCAP